MSNDQGSIHLTGGAPGRLLGHLWIVPPDRDCHGGFCIQCRKPSFLSRVMMRLVFGWQWVAPFDRKAAQHG